MADLVLNYMYIGFSWALLFALNIVFFAFLPEREKLNFYAFILLWVTWVLCNGAYLGFVIGLSRYLGG